MGVQDKCNVACETEGRVPWTICETAWVAPMHCTLPLPVTASRKQHRKRHWSEDQQPEEPLVDDQVETGRLELEGWLDSVVGQKRYEKDAARLQSEAWLHSVVGC